MTAFGGGGCFVVDDDTASSTTTTSRGINDDDGYLGMMLNAKVYDVALETELQHAKNLSRVSVSLHRE